MSHICSMNICSHKFWSTSIPKNFVTQTLSIHLFLIVIGTFTLDLVLATNIKFVLLEFNDTLLMLDQSFTLFNSLLTSVH